MVGEDDGRSVGVSEIEGATVGTQVGDREGVYVGEGVVGVRVGKEVVGLLDGTNVGTDVDGTGVGASFANL